MTFSLTPPFGALIDTRNPSLDPLAPAPSRAVIIGGGMGGLLAARALALHFDEVMVLERDSLSTGDGHRKGTPQSHHVHALLGRGLMTIERMMPGFTADLVARGAVTSDAMTRVGWHQAEIRHASGPAGFTAVVASRPLIEAVLRERVRAIANVTIREQVAVHDLRWNAPRTRVTGVIASSASGERGFDLPADLVVDASGRGTRIGDWLEQAGYECPAEQVLDINVRYASRLFRRQAGDFGGNVVTIVSAVPENQRGGLAFAVEGDRWLVTLSGRNGLTPPADLEGFIAYAAELDADDIARFLRQAEPLGEAKTYFMPRSRRRFARAPERFPDGLLPFADAICAFNPVFGQGMSVAAMEASVLNACLDDGTESLIQRFLAGCAPVVDGAWKLAAGNDLRFLPGRPALPRGIRMLHWYLDQLNIAAGHDVEVARAFAKVVHMMEPPPSLMRPAIVARVMRTRLTRLAPSSRAPRSISIDQAGLGYGGEAPSPAPDLAS